MFGVFFVLSVIVARLINLFFCSSFAPLVSVLYLYFHIFVALVGLIGLLPTYVYCVVCCA